MSDEGARGPRPVATAAPTLAVLTCIDPRIEPLAVLGSEPGEVTVLRNAGARVTDDALRSLVVATGLLGVSRVWIVQHTDCAMVGTSDDALRERIGAARGVDASGWEFLSMTDQRGALLSDVERVTSCAAIPTDLEVEGYVLDLRTHELHRIQDR